MCIATLKQAGKLHSASEPKRYFIDEADVHIGELLVVLHCYYFVFSVKYVLYDAKLRAFHFFKRC